MDKPQYVLEIANVNEIAIDSQNHFPLTKILQDNNNIDTSFTINDTKKIDELYDFLDTLLGNNQYETLQQNLEKHAQKKRIKTGEGWLI